MHTNRAAMEDEGLAGVGAVQGEGALAGGTRASEKMRALVIDDEPQVREFVAGVLGEEGWQVGESETAERAFVMMGERPYALVFCDVMLSGGEDGFAVLRRLTDEQPDAHIVLMTGYGSAAGALDATAFGAFDYLLKPFGVAEVLAVSAAVRARLERGRRATPESEKTAYVHTSDLALIGRSPAFVKVMKLVGRLAATSLPVLITGESGTGKEVVARAIHRRSARASTPFVTVNCGALPSELIESELFGHVRGSFTGAERDRPGLLEEADGGTLFLDEVTETALAFQVKLLRVLQQGEVRRVGSNRTTHIDVRVIAATNRDPEKEVSEGRFRQDLFYRLNAVSLHLPPLRERREDIMPLARHFAAAVARGTRARAPHFSRDAVRLLEQYDWPGNIRELENAVVRAAAISDETIRAEDLPDRIRAHRGEATPSAKGVAEVTGADEWPTLSEVEGRYVGRVLRHTGGNKQAAARILSVDRKTLLRMIRRHGLAARGGESGE
jgi:two-component system, NtrC family, response regulator AtoC